MFLYVTLEVRFALITILLKSACFFCGAKDNCSFYIKFRFQLWSSDVEYNL